MRVQHHASHEPHRQRNPLSRRHSATPARNSSPIVTPPASGMQQRTCAPAARFARIGHHTRVCMICEHESRQVSLPNARKLPQTSPSSPRLMQWPPQFTVLQRGTPACFIEATALNTDMREEMGEGCSERVDRSAGQVSTAGQRRTLGSWGRAGQRRTLGSLAAPEPAYYHDELT
jgi:hypothetical protein